MRPVGWPPTACGGPGRTPDHPPGVITWPLLAALGLGRPIQCAPASASAQIPPTRVRNQVLGWRGFLTPFQGGKRGLGVWGARPTRQGEVVGGGGCQSRELFHLRLYKTPAGFYRTRQPGRSPSTPDCAARPRRAAALAGAFAFFFFFFPACFPDTFFFFFRSKSKSEREPPPAVECSFARQSSPTFPLPPNSARVSTGSAGARKSVRL